MLDYQYCNQLNEKDGVFINILQMSEGKKKKVLRRELCRIPMKFIA